MPALLVAGSRRSLAGLATLVVALLLVVLTPASGSAHAYLQSSNPADGATLTQGPQHLRLGFSEHVVLSATKVVLTDSAGHAHPVTGLRLATEDAGDTEEPATIVGALPDLPRDTYRVAWQTLSSDDLHQTSGTFVFGVRTSVQPSPFHETAPLPGESAATAMLLVGLALAFGGLLARRSLSRVPGPTGSALRLLLQRVARGGVLLALVGSVVPVVADLLGSGPARLTSSGSYDVRWAVREAGLVLLLLAVSGRRGDAGRSSRVALIVGGCLAAAGMASLGHAATAPDQPVRLAATALHLVAALTWAGAVACLGLALLRARRALPRPYVRAALRRFGRPAASCLAVAAVTGTYLASDTIGSVDAALRTTYGRSFLLKLVLVALAACVALVNHRRIRSRSEGVPTSTVAVEGLVALLVVLVTAVLVSGQPATEPQLVDRGPAATVGPLAGRFADLQESFDIRPNRPGDGSAVVTVFDSRRPSPGPVTAVSLRMGIHHPVPATQVNDGTWAARLPALSEGPVEVEVRVTRAGAPTVTAHYAWTVATAGRPEPRLVSRAPLRMPLQWAALASALGIALATGLRLRLRRRSGRARSSTVPLEVPAPPEPEPQHVLAGRP